MGADALIALGAATDTWTGYSPRRVVSIQHGVSLAAKTTLQLGGAAAEFAEVTDVDGLVDALNWADRGGRDCLIIGGGSNLVVADEGFDGLVIRPNIRGLDVSVNGPVARVRVGAGEPWDAVVAAAAASDLSGIECLSGIPGQTGATPIQNVGAYGQEIADVLRRVRAFDRVTRDLVDLSVADCALSYRDSAMRRQPNRWVVVEVEFELSVAGRAELRYAELAARIGDAPATPSRVREVVLELRRAKSMVLDDSDDNRRSAGSFFTNPIVPASVAADVENKARQRGLLDNRSLPRWPMDDGHVKLAAGWLIEAAGFSKGDRRGAVGISTAHALALVHHGGGTTSQLLALAREIRDRVRDAFGVTLRPEPVMVGVEF